LGRKFWTEVYKQAQKKYGTTDIPVDTFNKVWIVPEKAVVYENHQSPVTSHPRTSGGGGLCRRSEIEGDAGE